MEGYWGGGSYSYTEEDNPVIEEPKRKLAKFEDLKWFSSYRGILYDGEIFDEDCMRKDVIMVTNMESIESFYQQNWNVISIQCEVLDHSHGRYKVVVHSISVCNNKVDKPFTQTIFQN